MITIFEKFNIDNSKKRTDGYLVEKSLGNQLNFLLRKGYLLDIKLATHCGYPNFSDKQFTVDYEITLPSGDIHILESVTSITSDRLHTKEWRIENIKKINPEISKAYLIISDTIKSYEHSTNSRNKGYFRNVINYRNYIKNGDWYSYIDDILFQSDYINQIEDSVLAKNGEKSFSAKKGLKYEELITEVLNYEDNLLILQGKLSLAGGWDYETFKLIVDGFNLDPDTIESISATCNIPNLPTYKYRNPAYGTEKKGGRPRTDIAVYITFKNKETILHTISCKNTSATAVTCFEWFPEHLCDVLNLPYSAYNAIKKFQFAGGITKMSAAEQELLFTELAPYVDQINIFALSGSAPNNSTRATPEQIAEYILTRSNGKITFETIPEYINKCKIANFGQMGTILSWSVASKKTKKDGTKPDPKPIFKMKVLK